MQCIGSDVFWSQRWLKGSSFHCSGDSRHVGKEHGGTERQPARPASKPDGKGRRTTHLCDPMRASEHEHVQHLFAITLLSPGRGNVGGTGLVYVSVCV